MFVLGSGVIVSGSSVRCHCIGKGCQMFILGSGVRCHSVRE